MVKAKDPLAFSLRPSRLGALAAAIAMATFTPKQARAQSEEDGVFTYGFRGLGVGAPVGAAAGYLLTRDDNWQSDDWKDLGMGVAIGAITGAVGGIAIGITDLSDGRMGMGATVLRDTWYGTLLGITVGAIVGGVLVMDSGEGEDILQAMAWGAVIGAPVGIGVGFLEAGMRGQIGSANPNRYAYLPAAGSPTPSREQLSFALVPMRAPTPKAMTGSLGQELVWVPTLVGTF